MSSNLFKRGTTLISNDNTRVIDVNELIARRMESLANQAKTMPAEEILGGERPEPDQVDALLADDEFQSLADTAPVEEVVEEETPEELTARAKEILEEANAEARGILESAQKQAQAEAELIFADAKDKGYEQGYAEAKEALEQERQALEQKAFELEQEYNEMLEGAERQLVDALSSIYEHLIGVSFKNDKEVLVHMLSSAIRGMEGSKNFILHVSTEDYTEVFSRIEELTLCIPGKDSYLEVVSDSNLEQMECRIETENGIFDCGLDAQLAEVKKKLVLLSYDKA